MPSNKKYCLDTSGLSNPLETMPETISIYNGIWALVRKHIEEGSFAVTQEIYEELCHISPGAVCDCCSNNKDQLVMEVDQPDWDATGYITNVNEMVERHKGIISEYNGNRKNTVGLNDVSIVALAKTLKLPVVSMESDSVQPSTTKVRIPGLCRLEGVQHMTFNNFLEQEA